MRSFRSKQQGTPCCCRQLRWCSCRGSSASLLCCSACCSACCALLAPLLPPRQLLLLLWRSISLWLCGLYHPLLLLLCCCPGITCCLGLGCSQDLLPLLLL